MNMSFIKELALIIVVPVVLSVVANILYDFFAPKFKTWNARQSVNSAKYGIEQINEHIDYVKNYAEDTEKTIRFATQEVLAVCYSFSLIALYLSIGFVIPKIDVLREDFEFMAILFVGGGSFRAASKALGRVLKSYRLVRDANNFERFLERRKEEMSSLEAVINRLESR